MMTPSRDHDNDKSKLVANIDGFSLSLSASYSEDFSRYFSREPKLRSMSMSTSNANMGSIHEVRFDNRNCRCDSKAMVKISQSTDNPNCLYFVCPHSPNGCKIFEWWIPPHMQHNLKMVKNDILEECMDVLSTLREVIILNRELKDMTVKSRKQYRDLAMVIE